MRTRPTLLGQTAGTLLAAADARLVRALVDRSTVRGAAQAEGVSSDFVWQRLCDGHFRERLKTASLARAEDTDDGSHPKRTEGGKP